MAALFSTLGALLFGLDIGYISGVENMQGFADDVNNGSTIDPESLGYVRARVRTCASREAVRLQDGYELLTNLVVLDCRQQQRHLTTRTR